MLRLYGKYWWLFALRGLFSLIFGIVAIGLPGVTLELLTFLLAAFFVADGTLAFVSSFQRRGLKVKREYLLVEGLAGICLGILTFLWPELTVLAITTIIGLWAMVIGIVILLASIKLRSEIKGEWLLGIGGILSIMFSMVLFLHPALSAVAMIWLMGVYFILFGISLIFLGLRLRKHYVILNL